MRKSQGLKPTSKIVSIHFPHIVFPFVQFSKIPQSLDFNYVAENNSRTKLSALGNLRIRDPKRTEELELEEEFQLLELGSH